MKLDVREQLGRFETEETMALAHRDYAKATEIANRRIRLMDFRPEARTPRLPNAGRPVRA